MVILAASHALLNVDVETNRETVPLNRYPLLVPCLATCSVTFSATYSGTGMLLVSPGFLDFKTLTLEPFSTCRARVRTVMSSEKSLSLTAFASDCRRPRPQGKPYGESQVRGKGISELYHHVIAAQRDKRVVNGLVLGRKPDSLEVMRQDFFLPDSFIHGGSNDCLAEHDLSPCLPL